MYKKLRKIGKTFMIVIFHTFFMPEIVHHYFYLNETYVGKEFRLNLKFTLETKLMYFIIRAFVGMLSETIP
jgi:hypothetical protein